MQWLLICVSALWTLMPPAHAAPVASPDASATTLIRHVQDMLRSDTSIARYAMHIETPDWQREIRFDAWDDRRRKRLFIRVLSPRKERGAAWLKDGGNLWMYLPKLERDIRIPPSMMLSSWMGSDFTNDDLVKMESVVEDYTHRITAEDETGWTVESIPRPDAPVVWGKLVHRIGRDGLPLEERFFDEHGRLARTLRFLDPRVMDGRRIPTRWVMQPADKPGRRTEMRIERIDFDAPIPDSVFTRANLRRGAD